jgi:hypothetical protein
MEVSVVLLVGCFYELALDCVKSLDQIIIDLLPSCSHFCV